MCQCVVIQLFGTTVCDQISENSVLSAGLSSRGVINIIQIGLEKQRKVGENSFTQKQEAHLEYVHR